MRTRLGLLAMASCFVITFFLVGCAAVKMVGNVYKAAGDVIVDSADKEEKKMQAEEAAKKGPGNGEVKTANAENISAKVIVTAKKTVNVRPTPSVKGASIAVLRVGDKAEKVGELNGWVNISYDGINGWVKRDFVN